MLCDLGPRWTPAEREGVEGGLTMSGRELNVLGFGHRVGVGVSTAWHYGSERHRQKTHLGVSYEYLQSLVNNP